MVSLANRNHTIQLVYCGPFGSGKTTNLRRLAAWLPDRFRSRLLTVDSPVRRSAGDDSSTHCFDLLPIVIDTDQGRLKLRLLSVPGNLMYEPTRRLLLRGADGVVFVADGTLPAEENQQSFAELRSSLRENGRAPDSMPLVIQLNKSDVSAQRTSVEQAQTLSGTRSDVAVIAACAERGTGVAPTLLHLMRMVWPTALHEHESLASLGIDLPQLLSRLRQRLHVRDDEPPGGHTP